MGGVSSRYTRMTDNNNPCIHDIQPIVHFWATSVLTQEPIRKNIRSFFKFYKPCELELNCQYDEIKVMYSDIIYEDFDDTDHTTNQVLMRTQFTNDSYIDQINQFKVSRKRPCSITVNLEKALCVGNQTKLRMPIPKEILKETTDFGNRVTVSQVPTWEYTKEIDWSSEQDVRLLPNSSVTVEKILKEKEIFAWFKVPVALKGNVNVLVSDPNTGKQLKVLEASLCHIISTVLSISSTMEQSDFNTSAVVVNYGKHSKVTGSSNHIYCNIGDDMVMFECRGNACFKYGVQQYVNVIEDSRSSSPTSQLGRQYQSEEEQSRKRSPPARQVTTEELLAALAADNSGQHNDYDEQHFIDQ